MTILFTLAAEGGAHDFTARLESGREAFISISMPPHGTMGVIIEGTCGRRSELRRWEGEEPLSQALLSIAASLLEDDPEPVREGSAAQAQAMLSEALALVSGKGGEAHPSRADGPKTGANAPPSALARALEAEADRLLGEDAARVGEEAMKDLGGIFERVWGQEPD